MNSIWWILQLVLTVVETGLCFAFYRMILGEGRKTKWKWAVEALAILVVVCMWSSNRMFSMVSNTVVFINTFLFLIVVMPYERRHYVLSLEIVLIYFVSNDLLNVFYGSIVQFYMGDKKYFEKVHIGSPTGWRILIYIATIATLLCIYLLVRIVHNWIDLQRLRNVLWIFDFQEWWVLTWGIGQMIDSGQTRSLWTVSILLLLISTACIFLITYLHHVIDKMKNERIEEENKMAKKNYRQIKNLVENSMINLHDWKNHLLVLQSYVDSKEFDKVEAYLNKIGESVEMLNNYIWCNNEVLNLIMNTKIMEAREKQIRISVNVENIDIEMEDQDLCSILGNLIDNAIEACEKLDIEKRWITISIQEKPGSIIIKMANSTQQSAAEKDHKYVTSKQGNHGYGLKSVRNAVEKNHGVMKISNSEDTFRVTITFFT